MKPTAWERCCAIVLTFLASFTIVHVAAAAPPETVLVLNLRNLSSLPAAKDRTELAYKLYRLPDRQQMPVEQLELVQSGTCKIDANVQLTLPPIKLHEGYLLRLAADEKQAAGGWNSPRPHRPRLPRPHRTNPRSRHRPMQRTDVGLPCTCPAHKPGTSPRGKRPGTIPRSQPLSPRSDA